MGTPREGTATPTSRLKSKFRTFANTASEFRQHVPVHESLQCSFLQRVKLWQGSEETCGSTGATSFSEAEQARWQEW